MAKIELINVGSETYPAAITNYSLSMGQKLDLMGSSQLEEFIESEHHAAIIYLSIIGLNKNLNLSIDEFTDKYKPNKIELVKNYKNIISNSTDIPPNNFAKSFNAVTKKGSSNPEEKKKKPPNLKFECVEDRYVYYCLIYGIPDNIFWHHPIPDVERIFESKQAYDSWQSNPVTY